MSSETELRDAMVEVGLRLWQRGLVGGGEGNLSCRIDRDRLLCTPTAVSLGELEPSELVLIDQEGRPLGEGTPSSEIRLHLAFYRRRPDCSAVVHAHPLVATAFALAHRPIPHEVSPEATVELGPIALCPFGMPGTEELADSVTPYVRDHETFLLANHGAATLGANLGEAARRMEILERVATMVWFAEALGGACPLPADAYSRLRP